MFNNKKSTRIKSILSFEVCNHFSKSKWFYIVLISLALIFLIIGLVVGFSKNDNLTISMMPDGIFVSFIEKKVSGATLFFSRFFSFVFLVLVVWLVNSKKFLCWITLIILCYQAFLVGVNCAIIISVYHVGGFLSVLLIYFPTKLIFLSCLLIWALVCLKSCLKSAQTGQSVLSINFIKCQKLILITIIVVMFLTCLLETILLPYANAAVFVGIK